MDKKIGLALALAGIILIAWGVWQSFFIFSGRSQAPIIFKVPAVREVQASSAGNAQEQLVRQIISEQIGNLLPPEYVSQLLNLTSWSIFMMILFLGGSRMSVMGIRMIKE